MAQQFNLETLIKQAKQRHTTQGINQAFTNKIDHFTGDNDQVNDEFESSPEKSQTLSPNPQQKSLLYNKNVIQSPNEEESMYGLSSDSKLRLSYTPNCNITDRSGGGNRIFSDLSAKVVNINNGTSGLQNPFFMNQQQQQVTQQQQQTVQSFKYQQEQTVEEEVQQNEYDDRAYQTNELFHNISQVQDNPQQRHNLNSELCNYDSIQVKNQPPVSPFDIMKQEYMAQKSQVLDKYEKNIDSSDKKQSSTFEQDEVIEKKEQLPLQEQHTPKKQQVISESTQNFFDQIKEVKQNSNSKTPAVAKLAEEQFLTFDDFLNRGSTKAKDNLVQKGSHSPVNEVANQKNQIEFQKANINDYQSPRVNLVDKNYLIKKEKDQENKKKREMEMLKQKAKEKEILRQKRLKAAIMIQKWVRGHIQRREFNKMQINFRYMRKFRRMMSIAYYKYRQRMLNNLITILKQAGEQKKNQVDEMFKQFMDHCVNLIQKTWRAYFSRKYIIPGLLQEYRINRALIAVVKGWKIRRILQGCREVITIKRDLVELQQHFRKVKGPKDPLISQLMVAKRRKIEELCRIVPNLFKNGRWIYSQQRMLQNLKAQSRITSQRKQSPSPQVQSQFGYRSQHLEMTGRVQGYPESVSRQIDFEQYYDSSKKFERTMKPQKPQEEDRQSVLWPSQKTPQEESQVLWPSQKGATTESDQSAIIWPSQKQTVEPIAQPTDRLEDLPFSQRTAIGDKMHMLENNKKQFKQQIEVQSSTEEYDSQSQFRKNPQKSPVKKHFLEDDDRPIKPASNFQFQFEKVPVGAQNQHNDDDKPQLKKNPVFLETEEMSQFSDENKAMKVPLIAQKFVTNSGQKVATNTNTAESPIKPPSYNFEEMLEKALQEQPQAVGNNKRQNSAIRRAKTTRLEEESEDQQNDNGSDKKPKTKKEAKKQNLKKRQKYDPRKAIEEAKKQQQEGEKTHKSAFPEGLIGNSSKTDRIRSQTSQPKVDNDEQDTKSQVKEKSVKRKTQKQAQNDREEEEKQRQQEQYEDQQSEQLTNASSQAPKSFLKRKDRGQPVIKAKCNWKVESRINCWGNKGSQDTRSNNQSQTRRKTSQLRSPKQSIPNKSQQQEENKSGINNLKKNIQQTPPPLKKQQTQPAPKTSQQLAPQVNTQQQQQQYVRHQQQQQMIQNCFSQAPIQIPVQQQVQPVQVVNINARSMMKLPMTRQVQDDTLDIDDIPDENDQIEETQYQQYSQIQQQQFNTFSLQQNINMAQLQQQMPSNDVMFSSGGNNQEQQQNDNVTLQLEELEKVFEMFHPKLQSFEDSQIQETTRDTIIPHMTMNSMFFACYSDDIYDTILEDLREHYIQLCNE